MDGLAEMTAAAVVVHVAGSAWRLRPLRLCDWGEIERQVVTARPDPLESIASSLAALDEADRRHLLGLVYDDLRRGAWATADELFEWLSTPRGRVFHFWLAVRQEHPELTLDAADVLLRAIGEGTCGQAIDERLQEDREDLLGN